MRISLSLILLTFGCATKPIPRDPAQVDPLFEIVSRRTITLDRDLVTFHYQDGGESYFNPQNGEQAWGRLAGRGERFFDVTLDGNANIGPAIYVATDPGASRSYGRAKPQLWVITIPKGTAILDAATIASEQEQAALSAFARERGCKWYNQGRDFEFEKYFAGFRRSSTEACRQVLIDAVAKTGAAAIAYNWGGSPTLDECRHSRKPAIAIIKDDAIARDRLNYYDDEKSFERIPLRAHVARLFEEAERDPISTSSETLIVRSLTGYPVPEPEYRAWKKASIFRCGSPWSLERPDPRVAAIDRLYRAYYDSEVLDAVSAWKKAVRRRSKDFSTDVTRIRQLQPLDDDRVLMNSNDTDLARAFGEAPPREPLRQNWDELVYAFMSRPEAPSPEALFASRGYGPKLARYRANGLIAELGGVPNFSDSRAEDRRRYLEVLRACKRAFNDPSVTLDVLKSGPCGTIASH